MDQINEELKVDASIEKGTCRKYKDLNGKRGQKCLKIDEETASSTGMKTLNKSDDTTRHAVKTVEHIFKRYFEKDDGDTSPLQTLYLNETSEREKSLPETGVRPGEVQNKRKHDPWHQNQDSAESSPRNQHQKNNNQIDDYSKIDKMLIQNDKFELKECEFIFKSPVNKAYLIKIQEVGEKSMKNKQSREGTKNSGNKLMNFITRKGKTRQTACKENINEIKGRKTGESKNGKYKIKTKITGTKDNNIELKEYGPTFNKVGYRLKSNQRETCQEDSGPSDSSQSQDTKDTIINEGSSELEETGDEFGFLNELCSDISGDRSDSIESKLEKKRFFQEFFQFLQDNKYEIRRQYQQYRTNRTLRGASGDYSYFC